MRERQASRHLWHRSGLVAALAVTGLFMVARYVTNKDPSSSSSSRTHSTWLELLTDAASPAATPAVAAVPPHIVFILADDLSWNALGGFDAASDIAFAASGLQTLAAQGIRMTNYYAQELCTPSRAALLTGRYPVSMGMQYGTVLASKPWGMPLDETTVAEVLRAAGGYKTHAIGKWHLGHHTANYLPTARGFDTFTGYLDGENNYFSKRDPQNLGYRDFMTSDTACYYVYNKTDVGTYSTRLYRDLAVDIIHAHDPDTAPLFMYLAFQAVHSPFEDAVGQQVIPREYLDGDVYDRITATVQGYKRQLYAMALAAMDAAVTDVVQALDQKGMLARTHLIFASDNGGCYMGGGKNAPLRGTKATVLEGGTRVDAFISSAMLASSPWQGKEFPHLFHVTDWFPTILDMAGVRVDRTDAATGAAGKAAAFVYAPPAATADGSKSLSIDGVSHWSTLRGPFATGPARTKMLYNSFTSIAGARRNIWTNGTFAIRNDRYKLIHFYNSTRYAKWYDTDASGVLDDDDNLESKQCQYTSAQASSKHGTTPPAFVYALFDLQSDPYEKVNLYDDADYAAVKAELYADLAAVHARAAPDQSEGVTQELTTCEATWQAAGGYIVPFHDAESPAAVGGPEGIVRAAPALCGVWDDGSSQGTAGVGRR